jgi:hypothetical protein
VQVRNLTGPVSVARHACEHGRLEGCRGGRAWVRRAGAEDLRRPRISGIEAEFAGGELTFGSMPDARKGADLHRDPRFALHSPSEDPPEDDPTRWVGDAKIAGRAVPAGEVGGDTQGELFRADITEVVVTGLNPDASALVIEIWTPSSGLRRVERS